MATDAVAVWGISLEQTVALLKHRCAIVHYDEPLHDDEIRTGSPKSCLPIVRFLFVRFSQVLAQHLEDNGHHFKDEMSDAELMHTVLQSWSLVSPHPQLGSLTVEKLLCHGSWNIDRLLFVMQCLLVCSEKHRALTQRKIPHEESFFVASSLPFGQSDVKRPFSGPARELDGSSTMQWMADVYREQLNSLEQPVDGKQDQAKWVAALEASSSWSSLDADPPLLDASHHDVYRKQLLSAGLNPSTGAGADAKRMAETYAARMGELSLATAGQTEEDEFDDSRFESAFIVDATK